MSGARHRRLPGVFAFHSANGGFRKPVEAAIMKGLGVTAGVPDVIAIHEGRSYAMEINWPAIIATALAMLAAAGIIERPSPLTFQAGCKADDRKRRQ